MKTLINKVERAIAKAKIEYLYSLEPIIKGNKWEIQSYKIKYDTSALSKHTDLIGNAHLKSFILDVLSLQVLAEVFKMLQTNPKQKFLIELTLEAITSEIFQLFDSSLTDEQKEAIEIGIHVKEFFENQHAYSTLVKALKESGYKICSFGATYQSFPYLDRDALNTEQLILNSEFISLEHSKGSFANSFPKNSIILSECNTKSLMTKALNQGFDLFTGTYITKYAEKYSKRQ